MVPGLRIRSWLKESSARKWPMVVRYIRLPSSWSRVTGKNEERGEFPAEVWSARMRMWSIWRQLGLKSCCRSSGCDGVRGGLWSHPWLQESGPDHLDGRTDRVAAMSLAHEVAHGRCVWSWYSHWFCWRLLVDTAGGVGVVVTPPLESARGLCRSTKASVRTLS